MSQPIQVFVTGDPANGYSVVDNSTPGNQGGFFGGPGYDTIVTPGGANAQFTNAFSNGTIPDAVSRSKSFTCTTAGVTNITKYLNPA